MQFLKQSTAVTLKIGPFLDDTDGKTAETGLTIAQADVRVSKNGANIIPKNEATSCTHDEIGIYGCPIDGTDTSALGRLQLWVHESGALPVWHEFMVVPTNVYNSLFSTGKLQVDMVHISGDENAANNLELDYDGTGYAKANSTIGTCTTNTDMVGTDGANTTVPDAAGVAPTVGEIRTEMEGAGTKLLAIEGYTDKIDDATNGLTAIKAEVEGLAGAAMRGTDGANTTVPDAAGTAPTPAEINAEMVDVMKTDTTAEPSQGAPPATPTFEDMIAYIYFRLRNKTTTTSSEDAMWDNAGTTKLIKATISDNGTTFEKSEYVSGA